MLDEASRENLQLMQLDWYLFVKCIVKDDKLRGYIITTLSYSKGCSGNMPLLQARGSSRCRHQLARVCTIFWDVEGVLVIDFMSHKETVTGVYYADLLHKLLLAINQKWRGKLSQLMLLLHDNAYLLISHMLNRLLYLNLDLKKCAIHQLS